MRSPRAAQTAKRPRLEVFDAQNDTSSLSSKLVKKCKWTADAPASILDKMFAGPNKACVALRDALDPSKKAMGAAGISTPRPKTCSATCLALSHLNDPATQT